VDDLIAPVEDREIQVISPLRLVRRAAEATKLGLVGDVIGYVAYRQVHEGVTFGLTRIYHPPSVVDALADVEFLHTEGGVAREFVISMLDRRLPHPIALARQIISAIASPADVAAVLDCPPGKPLLKIEFLYFDTDARPIQLNINFYNPELYEYRAQLRRRPESASSTWATQLGSQIPAGVMPHE
jgi:DNA-binding GntR family transcriptional regulator